MKNFISIIKKSIFDKNGKESSTRIHAYIIILLIFFYTLMLMGILIAKITIPWEAIVIYSLLLTHHLGLLGINKKFETKMIENKNSLPILSSTEEKNKPKQPIQKIDKELKNESDNLDI